MTATRQYCTFTLCGRLFGVDVTRVQEVLRHQPVTRVPMASSVIAGLMNLRGQVVMAVDLRAQLGLEARADGEEPPSLVIRREEAPVSLVVDEIGQVVEVEEERFEEPPQTLQGRARGLIRGAYKLDDRLLLVLDVDRAVSVPEGAAT